MKDWAFMWDCIAIPFWIFILWRSNDWMISIVIFVALIVDSYLVYKKLVTR